MTHDAWKSIRTRRAREFSARLKRFRRDEQGSLIIFALFLFLGMLMIGGLAVDFMRHEANRTMLQNTLDRATLAATDLDQVQDAKTVVEDYFQKAGLLEYLGDVTPVSGVNFRTVEAQASMTIPTFFIKLVGIDTLDVNVGNVASERLPNAEISVVLDISGSMRWNERDENLEDAAQNFLAEVLKGEAARTTSVNIIPYAGMTNPGPFMFNRLGGVRYGAPVIANQWYEDGDLDDPYDNYFGDTEDIAFPNNSSCIDFGADDFLHADLPDNGSYDQVPLFMNWTIDWPHMEWGWCPSDAMAIQYARNDLGTFDPITETGTGLLGWIEDMRLHDGTGTHYGAKYGLALLNPSSQPHFAAMADAGLIDNDFRNRPAPWNDQETIKHLIIMTDGKVTEQVRPKVALDVDNPFAELNDGRTGDRTRITTRSENVDSLYAICNFAKAQGVYVYTIAFETDSDGRDEMRNCSSGPGYYFEVEGRDAIIGAFDAIAYHINKLRLMQ